MESFSPLRAEALATFDGQLSQALDCRASYALFEQSEGAEWHRQQLIHGACGNASEFSLGLRTGERERITEGHGDLQWSFLVGADAYFPDKTAHPDAYADAMRKLAGRYADARVDLGQGEWQREDLTTVRANLLESVCALPRYAAALDGQRTLPLANTLFESHLGSAIYWLTLAVPLANEVHWLDINPERNFAEHMQALEVRIALQTTYSQWRNGLLLEPEAHELIDDLALYAHAQGVPVETLREIWRKSPTRVRGMAGRGLSLPRAVLLKG